MERLKVVVLMACAALGSGCVGTTVTQKASRDVNFMAFKTATYSVHAMPTTEYGSDRKFADDEIGLFGDVLGRKLIAIGYAKPAEGAPADLHLDIAVTESKEGSGAARFWVGMGAGRAVLTFDATFTDASGAKIAGFQGGRSYTGMEFGHAFAGGDDIKIMAVTRACDQIQEFVKNNGNFPEDAPHKTPR